MNVTQKISTLILGSFLLGCSHSFDRTVKNVELDRFMGSWYVQAGRFTAFEKDPFNAIETYTWNEKEDRIDIDFRYNKGDFDGELKKMPQKAWIYNTDTNAHWKVRPFWPLSFSYLIIALDPNYEWTAIGVPNEKYLWIMSRNPHMTKAKTDEILSVLEKMGYAVNDIEYVKHSKKK